MLMASASIGAALIHAAVVPEHEDWWVSVVFFVGLAVFQLGWGVFLLLKPRSKAVLALGIGVNAFAIAAWLLSRTAGPPWGPHQGVAEPVARTDLLATVLEMAIVVVAAWALPRRAHVMQGRIAQSAVATGTVGVVIAAVSVVALSGAAGHAHAPSDDHEHPVGHLQPISVEQPAGPAGASNTGVLPTAGEPAAVAPVIKPSSDTAVLKKAVSKKGAAKIAAAKKAAAKKNVAKKGAANKTAPVPAPPAPVPPVPAPVTSPHEDDGHNH